MSATSFGSSMDESEKDQEANVGESVHSEGHANTENSKTPELKLDAGQLAALGVAVAVGLSVLMDKTEVRKVCSKVLHDPEVRDAGQALCQEISASWRRHGGMTVLASALLR